MIRRASAAALISVSIVFSVLLFLQVVSTQNEKFTVLYVFGPNKTAGLPSNCFLGENVSFHVGVYNHEGLKRDYVLRALLAGENFTEVLCEENFALENGETLEREVVISPKKAGVNFKVSVQLYLKENGLSSPYKEVFFWLNVSRGN